MYGIHSTSLYTEITEDYYEMTFFRGVTGVTLLQPCGKGAEMYCIHSRRGRDNRIYGQRETETEIES